MLSHYVSTPGPLHRIPAGPKVLGLAAVVLALSFLPSAWWAAGVAWGVACAGHLAAALGPRVFLAQLWSLRWIAAITVGMQLLFLPAEAAVANSSRVLSAVLLAGLLVLTTRVTDLLAALERGLRPAAALGIDPQRVSLLLTVTLTTLPVLARIAAGVREAQRARGARGGPATFVVPFLVVALKHADELGEALTARGVR
ncbi:CbiQ family ECF transporter T component [Zafaria sp. Z1313]|uniref:CbiQ family ECF transporter T component n=1 Tax=unclassified Zafaria TaxID=2828765 RepID=UPI002E7A6C61|nr:CbiQ family ECF transporter T component [Zafaria sp. J156]MEE1620871.1 CbiQ family ECF transporter T component [Zafaria sp. J156]